MSQNGSPLAGVRVAYAAFEPFPNAKGSGTRISQMLRALAEAGAEVRLYSLPGHHAEHSCLRGWTIAPWSSGNRTS